MNVALDYDGVVRGQELFRYVILMVYKMQLRVGCVEPCWLLSAGDEVNFAHPRGEFLHAAEPVFKETVIAEAGFRHSVLSVFLVAGVFCEIGLPLGVVHVDPCDYKIYIHECDCILLMLLLQLLGVLEAVVRPQVQLRLPHDGLFEMPEV